jgi:hypothetical protein
MIQDGAKVISPTPSMFSHPTETNPPLSPCRLTSHEELSEPARPPTVKTAVMREYLLLSMPRHTGRKDVVSGGGSQVSDATGKLSSERW